MTIKLKQEKINQTIEKIKIKNTTACLIKHELYLALGPFSNMFISDPNKPSYALGCSQLNQARLDQAKIRL